MESLVPFLFFAGSLIYFFFGFYALRMNPRSGPNKLFFFLCLCFVQWTLFYGILHLTEIKNQAWFWYRAASVGGVLFISFLGHFFLCFGRLNKKHSFFNKFFYAFFYAPAIYFIHAVFSKKFGAVGLVYENRLWVLVWDSACLNLAAYSAWYFTVICFSFIMMLRMRKRASSRDERMQANVMLVSGAAAFFLGTAVNFLPIYTAIEFPAFGNLAVLIWIYGIWHVMSNYGFMNMTPEFAVDSILDSLQEAVILTDKQGVISWINPAAGRITGFNENELLAKSITALFPDEVSRLISLSESGRYKEILLIKKGNEPVSASLSVSSVVKGGCCAGYVFSFRDISLAKKAEKNLQQFKVLFNSANFGAAVAKTDGTIEYANDYFAGIHGYQKDEIEGKNLKLFHTRDQMAAVEKMHEEMMTTGSYNAREIWHVDRSGNEFPMLMNGFLIEDEKGEKLIAATAVDISELKKAERALKESESRFRDIAEASGEYIWEIDSGLKYTFATKRITEVLNRPMESIIGKPPFDFMPGDDAGRVKAEFLEICKSKKPFRGFECSSILPDGSLVWQSVSGSPVFDGEGGLTGYRGTAIDITRQKQDEIRIKSLSAERELLLNNISTHIWYMKDEKTYGFANEAHLSFLGLGIDDVEGRSVYDILPRKQAEEAVCSNREVIKTKQRMRPEQFIPDREGRTRLLGMSKMPVFDKQGRVEYILCTAADITEKKIAEEKIKESLRMKEDFISVVSHELRTPLTIIREGISIVKEGLCGPLNAQQSDLLGKVNKNIERLSRLIGDVLDFRKLELNKINICPKTNSINDIVSESARSLLSKIKSKNLDLIFELDESIPLFEFDADKITQVIINLVDNAVKFTSDGSVTVKSELAPGFARIWVKDTGKGFEGVNLNRIFDMFEQGRDILTAKPEGFGLGLAISRKIVRAHGGEINASSGGGRGAVFYFTLPLRENP